MFLPFNYYVGVDFVSQLFFSFLLFPSFNYELIVNLTPQLFFFFFCHFNFIVFIIYNFCSSFWMKIKIELFDEKIELLDEVGLFLWFLDYNSRYSYLFTTLYF